MPNRILRDGILRSPQVAKLGWAEEVFYRRLHSVVDDFGTYYADPGLLRADCYPRHLGKVSDSDIEKWLRACVDAALVRVYPALDGERYLQVLKFRQQVRATKSKFPQPIDECVADAQQVPSTGESLAHLDVSVSVVVSEDKQPTVAPTRPVAEPPPLHLVLEVTKPELPPPCPHLDVLALWAEVLPSLPQHLPSQWRGARADHLRTRWRETAVEKAWADQAQGIGYFRKLFSYVGKSHFLTGRVKPMGDKRPFVIELEWLVLPTNWAKVLEGKFHQEEAA